MQDKEILNLIDQIKEIRKLNDLPFFMTYYKQNAHTIQPNHISLMVEMIEKLTTIVELQTEKIEEIEKTLKRHELGLG